MVAAFDMSSRLWDVLGPLAEALLNVFEVATKGPAQKLLGLLATLTEQFRDWTESVEGNEALQRFFALSYDALVALMPLFAGLGKAISMLVTPHSVGLLETLSVALGKALPVVAALFNVLSRTGIVETFAILLGNVADVLVNSGMLDALGLLADVIGNALAAALPVVMKGLEALMPLFIGLTDALITLIPPLIDAILPAFIAMFDAMKPLIPVFTDLIGTLAELIAPLLVPLGEILAEVVGVFAILAPPIIAVIKALMPLLPIVARLLEILLPLVTLVLDIASAILEWVASILTAVTESEAFIAVVGFIADALSEAVGWVETLVGWIKSLIDWLGRIKMPDFSGFTKTIANIGSNMPWNATGSIVYGPRVVGVGEAGPEAIIPLTRPLSQIDPSVRGMAAMLRGQSGQGGGAYQAGPQKVVNAEVNVYPQQSDPEAVAMAVLNKVAVMVR
jgi:phage-related protein